MAQAVKKPQIETNQEERMGDALNDTIGVASSSFIIVEGIIKDKLIGGVERFIYNRMIESKKLPFSGEFIIQLGIRACQFALVYKDRGEREWFDVKTRDGRALNLHGEHRFSGK
jgi:hypothetical protein